MERVFSVDDMPWTDLKGLPGARGFEFKALTNDAYTKAYSCELVRLSGRSGPSKIQTETLPQATRSAILAVHVRFQLKSTNRIVYYN